MTPDPVAVLALELSPDDDLPAGVSTVRGFLVALLDTLWRESDRFSGKRPWGDSGWEAPIEKAFVRAGYVDGEIDAEEGWLNHVDSRAVDRIMLAAIAHLGTAPQPDIRTPPTHPHRGSGAFVVAVSD